MLSLDLRMTGLLLSPIGAALLVAAVSTPAQALDTCKVKVNRTDGTIQVSAKNVSTNPLWGYAAGKEVNTFSNAMTCIAAGTASKCELAASGLARITPPSDCTMYLKDDAASCTVFMKGCTPGSRDVTADVSVRVRHSIAQPVTDSGNVNLTFDTEDFDTDNLHSTVTDPDRLTAQTAGKYMIYGSVVWDSGGTGQRFLGIVHSVSGFIATSEMTPSSFGGGQSVVTHVDMAVGQFVQLVAYQSDPVVQNVLAIPAYSPVFGMVKIP